VKITLNHTRFLIIALPAVAIPVLIILFLPPAISSIYVSVIKPIPLLIGSVLALYVSFNYRKELQAAFIFLSIGLFIYMLAVIVGPYIQPHAGSYFQAIILFLQIANYSMLILFCINLLKVIDIRHLNNLGWAVFGLVVIICILITIYPIWPEIRDISNLDSQVVLYTLIRIVDAGLVIVLMPVVWLYIQYLKSQHKQSLTFTVIIFGVVWSTIADYIYEVISQTTLHSLLLEARLGIDIPDMLYIYGYMMIAVGLYAHRKQDQWGYNTIDKAMAGELSVSG
jgi:hypothetical protein